MKNTVIFLSVLVALIFSTQKTYSKGPVIVEIETNFKTVKEATQAAKTSLMKQKFVPTGGVTETGFQATRTTGSHADYYTADVSTEEKNGKIVVTITFIKSGTGMLKLQKVADEVKMELSGSPSSGMIQKSTSTDVSVAAKENLSPEQIQAKCSKFKNMKKGGLFLTIAGGAFVVSGIVLQSINSSNGTLYDAGRVMLPLGVIAVGGGIPLTIIGGKKTKQYCTF